MTSPLHHLRPFSALAIATVASAGAAFAQTETLIVDPYSGAAFPSVTTAVQAADPAKQTTILIRGRAIGAVPVLYDLPTTGELFPIALAPKTDLVWDAANSDTIGGFPVPPILRSSGPLGGGTCFQVSGSVQFTRQNTMLDGLWIAGFSRAVDIVGSGGPLGIRLRNMTINNCQFGVVVTDSAPTDDIDPLIKNCTFDNVAYPGLPAFPWGAPPPATFSVAHVWIVAASGGLVRGKIAQCSMSLLPVFTTTQAGSSWGVAVDVGDSSTVQTEVVNCTVDGMSPTPGAVPSRGLDFGIGGLIFWGGQAEMTIDRCRVDNCGIDGIFFRAQMQPGRAQVTENNGWQDFDLSQHYVRPLIKRCSVTGNGSIALALPIVPEYGHGIALVSRDGGRMAGTIQDCKVGEFAAGSAGLGIAGNADDGVMILAYSRFTPGGVFEPPLGGGTGSVHTAIVSVVERNDCYGNAASGVEVSYQAASGRPHVRKNRCYNNGIAGISNTLLGGSGGWNVFSSAEVYNNFVYNTPAAFLPVQPVGISGGFDVPGPGGGPLGPIGWYANSVASMSTTGISATSADLASVLRGNIAYWTAPPGADFVTSGGIAPDYCIGLGLTGPTNSTAPPLWVAPVPGDLHLSSPASPAYDGIPLTVWPPPAGSPQLFPSDDFDGQTRFLGLSYDIGADEL